NPALTAMHGDDAPQAILICPSNPYLSIDPILAVPGIRAALAAAPAPVVAISPLIGGQAVKGPTDKIMGELGMAATGSAIADHYDDIIDGLIVDIRDPPQIISVPSLRIDTLMQSLDDRMRVAEAALGFADTLA
ncbi:MAG: 2-phospho-L-lactate transferase, partial [Alphaproteobacteria bacterium]|nr:2-phospho-L-lactate transferase [Alphaproteobacteria bacterium]